MHWENAKADEVRRGLVRHGAERQDELPNSQQVDRGKFFGYLPGEVLKRLPGAPNKQFGFAVGRFQSGSRSR